MSKRPATLDEVRRRIAAMPPRVLDAAPLPEPPPVQKGPPAGWVGVPGLARLLGRPDAWVLRNLPVLEREGFPRRCRIVGLWEVAKVRAWVAARIERQYPPRR